jgi:hypothetical protein
MSDEFRWRAWFQRSSEPLFVLNRYRRIVFVNRAWEELTGIESANGLQLACRRRRPPADGDWAALVEHILCPPREVIEGRAARTLRLVAHPPQPRRSWEMDFLPFRGESGVLFVLGRITVGPIRSPATLPEAALTLRGKVGHRYTLDGLGSGVPAMQRVAEQARLAAALRVPVLLAGEPGTGKQWLARTIHELSPLRDRPFVALDCGRLPPAAIAGVLFGEGELAGTVAAGTVYLAEPGRLPRDLQLRLCFLLCHEEEAAPGPRVVAGSSRDPAEEVRSGRLLDELAARLGILVITFPPLRERREDLPWLIGRLLPQAADAAEHQVKKVADAALDALRAHRWPGNLNELYRALVSACGHARSDQIDLTDLPLYLRVEPAAAQGEERPLPLKTLLEQAERRLITLALKRAGGNKSRAAEILSVWRPLLLRRMQALGLEPIRPKKDKTQDADGPGSEER